MNRTHFMLSIALVIAGLGASAIVYSQLPDRMPTHWNIKGEVDDYGDKQWAAFLCPILMVGFLGLAFLLPWLSPKQFEIDSFRTTYSFIMLIILVFFGYLHLLMLWAGLKGNVDISRALIGGVCLLFVFLGNVLGKVRRNFWVGVRTPWTLASDRVWNDTHRLAAKMFVAAGLLGLIVVIIGLPPIPMFIGLFAMIMLAALVPVVYSLVHYKILQRKGEL